MTPTQKRQIIESCYSLGLSTPAFFGKFVGVSFNSHGTPVLLVHSKRAIPRSVLEKCEGKNVRILRVPKLDDARESGWVVLH